MFIKKTQYVTDIMVLLSAFKIEVISIPIIYFLHRADNNVCVNSIILCNNFQYHLFLIDLKTKQFITDLKYIRMIDVTKRLVIMTKLVYENSKHIVFKTRLRILK